MERKKYEIDGAEYTLAKVTTKRLAGYCELIGITDFSALSDPQFLAGLNAQLLNAGLDPEKLRKILSVCLIEDNAGVDINELDLSLVDEIFNDFFAQRLRR